MTGVLSLDDITSSTTGSTDSDQQQTSGSTGSATDLESACEAIDANVDHARKYIGEHGNQSGVVELAEAIAERGAELREIYEAYRATSDQNRIFQFWLRDTDMQFSAWADDFYGNSDDPESGTHNFNQQRARQDDVPGNLVLYKALYPEPQAEYPGEPVLWLAFDTIGYGDGVQDTHIYVPREYVESFSDFTIDVQGKARPRPPSDAELAELQGTNKSTGSSGASDSNGERNNMSGVPDPRAYTISEYEDRVGNLSLVECEEALQLERENSKHEGGRKGMKNLIYDRIDELESGNNSASDGNKADSGGSDSSDDSDESGAQMAGEVNGMGAEGHDISPEKIIELQENGWSKEEIIEFYG